MNWRWLRGKRRNEELTEEVETHLWLAEREEREAGKSDADARHAARREFGNVAMAEETTRDHWGMRWLDDFRQDLRGGLRMLRRSPGFTALAVLCLTLGIGANAAVFSSMEGVLFRPYPMVAHQERLMALSGTARGENGPTGVSWPDFEDLRKSSTLLDGMFVSKIMGTTLSLGNRAETLPGSIVSAIAQRLASTYPETNRGRGLRLWALWRTPFNHAATLLPTLELMMRGVTLTVMGAVVGAAAAIGLTRLMGDLLYGVSPRDPEAFGLAFVAMMVVAVAACVLPAWRAMGADPMRVLKG
jgi:hypothetical protein